MEAVMVRGFSVRSTVAVAAVLGLTATAVVATQQPAAGGRAGGQGAGGQGAGANAAPRPTPAVLVMKAEFKPAVAGKTEQLPFVQENVVDPNIELKQYGAGKDVLTNAGNPAQFIPFSAWTGTTSGPFALTFRHKTTAFDLTGGAKIRWATKTSGFHVVRPVIKLTDGSMFVGDVASENVAMMLVSEFPVGTVRWMKLDPMRVVTLGTPGGTFNQIWASPDLTKVDEVGFADLIPGSGHGAGGWVHVGSLEVYGKAVPRTGTN
jgi:hypothetical protein